MIFNMLEVVAAFIGLYFVPVLVVFMIVQRLFNKVTSGWCRSTRDMSGKTVIITGATSGIGKETALDLARRNARIIMPCRSMERGEQAAKEIIAQTGNKNVIVKKCDLSELSSVWKFAEDILETEDRLDVLINNAAIVPKAGRHLTSDGFEVQFATNHLGPFLLTNLLLDLLKKSAPSRIVNVSSAAYFWSYFLGGKFDFDNLNFEKKILGQYTSYCRTKLANILFTKELHRRLAGTNVTVNVLHPGIIDTNITRNAPKWFSCLIIPTVYKFQKTVEEGAQTIIYLAVSEEVEGVSGKFFYDCTAHKLLGFEANSEELAKKLWDVSIQLTGLNKANYLSLTAFPAQN